MNLGLPPQASTSSVIITMMAVQKKRASKTDRVQFWARLTIFGIVIYICIDVLLAFLRPDYSLLHNAESDYGRGPYYWIMDINFILRGVVSLSLVKALLIRFRGNTLLRLVSYCLVIWGIASGLLAFFADNPTGYVPLKSADTHLLLAFIAFIAIMIAMLSMVRQLRLLGYDRMTSSMLLALTFIAIVSLLLLEHAGIRPHSFGGLYERLFLGSVLLWEDIVAYALISNHTSA